MKALSNVFAIELCAYAVMSNHYHIVIRVNRSRAQAWSDREIVERWLSLFTGSYLASRFLNGETLGKAEQGALGSEIELWRDRLHNLSWFMRCLNEPIARMANQEDDCTGRFWEGRFRSQALLDEEALLACMAYVDLNPIRAGIATKPENSNFTSIKERIDKPYSTVLKSFRQNGESEEDIPFSFASYLELVDWAGRAIRSNKRGSIPNGTPLILQRLGMEQVALIQYLRHKPGHFHTALGTVVRLRLLAQSLGLTFIKGISFGRKLYCHQS